MFGILFILERLGSMRLVGLYQFVEGIFVMFLSAYVWTWMDKWNRKKGTLTVIAFNNITIVVSILLIVGCLSLASHIEWLYLVCLFGGILFSALSKCANEGEKLSFTKDWVVVMSQRAGETGGLANKNATLTIIEQSCQIIAPIMTGYALVYASYQWACFAFIGVNLLCWVFEHILLARLYSQIVELHNKRDIRRQSIISNTIDAAAAVTLNGSIKEDDQEGTDKKKKKVKDMNIFEWVAHVSRVFYRQDVFPAAICLAFMFMTVLGFDGLSISYGKAYGMSDLLLGWFKSAAGTLGVVGALSYSVPEKRVGVRWTGFIGLSIQQVFLWLCIASIWLPGTLFDASGYFSELTFARWWEQFKDTFRVDVVPNRNASSILLTTPVPVNADRSQLAIIIYFVGVTFARIGVWITDLAIMQIMQEKVTEEDRFSVFGVENALCQFFFVGKDLMAIVLPDPRTFGILIIVSVVFVFSGFGFYIGLFLEGWFY
ncbi:Solute carrier family 40 protein [Aphelenchoides bicaudatus]|nr:Solute carrier family 40 protein [Aphelenchoides bicaudatus]